MNVTPLASRIYRRISRSRKTFQQLSEKTWTLCPEETHVAPAAIALDGDLDKVTGYMEDTNPAFEMARLRGGPKRHGATVAYSLANVDFLDGHLYKGWTAHHLLQSKERMLGPTVRERLAEAALGCTLYGSVYFGHWVTDDLTTHLAAEELGTPVMPSRKHYGHEPELCQLMGIEQHPVTRAHVDRLVMLDDFGQNSFKRRRYETLRARLRAFAPAASGHRVMIRRGNSGNARALVNQEELGSFLESQEFVLVDPEKLTAGEIVRKVSGASLVVGVEGSHLVHGIMNLAKGGTLCVLQPPYRFNNVHKDYTDCLGMHYAHLTGRMVEGGFRIDLEEMKRLLDRIPAPR